MSLESIPENCLTFKWVVRDDNAFEIRELPIRLHRKRIFELEQELRRKDMELERCKLQLERQAHQLQAQRDEMSEIKMIMKDTDERLANLTISPLDNRIKFESGRPEDQGAWYWIFHKYQSGMVNAFKGSLVELAHQFAREEVISPTMERYVTENDTVTCESRADELMKAVQFALNGNPQNFRKVVNVLKMSDNHRCKSLGAKLADEYHLCNREEET